MPTGQAETSRRIPNRALARPKTLPTISRTSTGEPAIVTCACSNQSIAFICFLQR